MGQSTIAITIFNGKIHYFYHHIQLENPLFLSQFLKGKSTISSTIFYWENPLFLSPFLMGKPTISITIFNGTIHYCYHTF